MKKRVKPILAIGVAILIAGIAIVPAMGSHMAKINNEVFRKEQEFTKLVCYTFKENGEVIPVIKELPVQEAYRVIEQFENSKEAFKTLCSPLATEEEKEEVLPIVDKTLSMMRSVGLLPNEITNERAKELLTYNYGITDKSTIKDIKDLIRGKLRESNTPLKSLLKLAVNQKFRQLKRAGIADDMTLGEVKELSRRQTTPYGPGGNYPVLINFICGAVATCPSAFGFALGTHTLIPGPGIDLAIVWYGKGETFTISPFGVWSLTNPTIPQIGALALGFVGILLGVIPTGAILAVYLAGISLIYVGAGGS